MSDNKDWKVAYLATCDERDALRAKLDAAERHYGELRQWAVKACERDKTLPRFPTESEPGQHPE